MSTLDTIDGTAVAVRTLAANEAIVRRGLGTFVEVGEALMQIRDERQYQDAGFDRFGDYLSTRWDMSRRRGYEMIEAAEKTAIVRETSHTIPSSDSVARALPADPVQARDTWAATVEEHGPKPTAAQTAEVRERIAPKSTPTIPPAAPAAPRSKPARPTQLPKAAESWSDDERTTALALIDGQTVVSPSVRFSQWIEKYPQVDVTVDRGRWANPFVAGVDGGPDEVSHLYAEHYLPYKADLDIHELHGKALRAPTTVPGATTHARFLARLANQDRPPA